MMRILALEPHYGGSHKAFLDGWIANSTHSWTVLGLPAYKWKWRMRHSAVTLARAVTARREAGDTWDALFCSDMLNLAEFKGLAAPLELPSICYFHENQLTYPVQEERERDLHFAFTNLTTALAADRVWWNSAWHRDSFLTALQTFLNRMPDYAPADAVSCIAEKSAIHPPGIHPLPPRPPRKPGPIRLLWCARWEHDKDFDFFAEALTILDASDFDFRVSVIGEQFGTVPEAFDSFRRQLAHHIDRWGYEPTREDYIHTLQTHDLAISTARHEFFGISMVEAAAAGCHLLVPRRLAYPEVLAPSDAVHFYPDNASPPSLAGEIRHCAGSLLSCNTNERLQTGFENHVWTSRAPAMDEALEHLAEKSGFSAAKSQVRS